MAPPVPRPLEGPDRITPPRRVVGAAAVIAVLFTFPLVFVPYHLVGDPRGETDNHFWMLWRGITTALGHPGPLANFPDGIPIPTMDTVNLPFMAVGSILDPVVGYNLTLLANVVLGLLSAWWLARRFTGRGPALAAMVVAGASPFLSGAMEFGITEAWPLWLLSLHLAFLHRLAERSHWRDVLAAGLCLGGFAMSGWYHAFFGLVVEATVLPFYLVRAPRRRDFLLQGALALFLVLPSFLYLLAIRDFWAERWHLPGSIPPPFHPRWRSLPLNGTDLANLVLPSFGSVEISKCTYLGLPVLVLAGLGIRARPKEALPFALPAVILLLLAGGHWLRVAGHTLPGLQGPLPGPARLLTLVFPFLEGIGHWYRAVGPATVLLAVPAALGAERLRLPGNAVWIVPAILLADSLLLSQTTWPRHTYAPAPPTIYNLLPDEGALLELPLDNGREPFSSTPARIYNRWQPFHGLPTAENYEGPDAILSRSRLVAVAQARTGIEPTTPASWRTPSERTDPGPLELPGALDEEVAALAEMGFGAVLLHLDRAETPDDVEQLLTRALGEPDAAPADHRYWRLRP